MVQIGLNDNEKKVFVNGIQTAITNDIPDIIHENRLPTKNGNGQFRWNFLHKRVAESLGENFQIHYERRGAWEVLILFESNLGLTFSIMSESTFSALQKKTSKMRHYLSALVFKNKTSDAFELQTEMEICKVECDFLQIEQLREKILSDFSGIIENHILILFDSNFDIVKSVRAVLLTIQLEVAFSEDWSYLLEKPHLNASECFIFDKTMEETEPLVSLKPVKQDDQSSDFVRIARKKNDAV